MRAAAIRENGGRHVFQPHPLSPSPKERGVKCWLNNLFTQPHRQPLSEGEGSKMLVKQSFEHIGEFARSASAAVSAVSNTRKTFYSPLLRRGEWG